MAITKWLTPLIRLTHWRKRLESWRLVRVRRSFIPDTIVILYIIGTHCLYGSHIRGGEVRRTLSTRSRLFVLECKETNGGRHCIEFISCEFRELIWLVVVCYVPENIGTVSNTQTRSCFSIISGLGITCHKSIVYSDRRD